MEEREISACLEVAAEDAAEAEMMAARAAVEEEVEQAGAAMNFEEEAFDTKGTPLTKAERYRLEYVRRRALRQAAKKATKEARWQADCEMRQRFEQAYREAKAAGVPVKMNDLGIVCLMVPGSIRIDREIYNGEPGIADLKDLAENANQDRAERPAALARMKMLAEGMEQFGLTVDIDAETANIVRITRGEMMPYEFKINMKGAEAMAVHIDSIKQQIQYAQLHRKEFEKMKADAAEAGMELIGPKDGLFTLQGKETRIVCGCSKDNVAAAYRKIQPQKIGKKGYSKWNFYI